MRAFVEKYRIYIADSISGMGDEGKIAFRQLAHSPREFASKEEVYQWLADNPDYSREPIEYFILPYLRKEW